MAGLKACATDAGGRGGRVRVCGRVGVGVCVGVGGRVRVGGRVGVRDGRWAEIQGFFGIWHSAFGISSFTT